MNMNMNESYRFVYSWIALGHALSAQDESEHAINVYRTAMRLVPGNYYPVVLLARELVRLSIFIY